MAIFTVTNTNDSGTGSLRDTINQANLAAGLDQILFDESLANQTIILTNCELTITDDLIITGDTENDPNTRNIIIDAEGNSRIFKIDDGNDIADKSVEISGLTITGGREIGGGGIYNTENLILNHSSITGNTAPPQKFDSYYDYYLYSPSPGGGIYTSGILTLENSTVSENASGSGGGIHVSDGSLTITNSVITRNHSSRSIEYFILSGGDGGGISTFSSAVAITNSTISENFSEGSGGGIDAQSSSLSVLNSTISRNSASSIDIISTALGGGIQNINSATNIINSTISGNSVEAYHGFGVGGGGIYNTGTISITNSTINNNLSFGRSFFAIGGGGIVNSGIVQISWWDRR